MKRRRRVTLPASEGTLVEDAESVALFESAARALKCKYAKQGVSAFREFIGAVEEARRLPSTAVTGDPHPRRIRVQSCRPADRAMLKTEAGRELIAATVNTLTVGLNTIPGTESAYEIEVEALRKQGLWPFP